MITIIILLVLLALVYAALRLLEFGAVKGWRRWRDRQRGDEVIVIKGTGEDLPRPPRPNLRREPEAEDTAIGDTPGETAGP